MTEEKRLWNPFNCDQLTEEGCKHDFGMNYCSNAEECMNAFVENMNIAKIPLHRYVEIMINIVGDEPTFQMLQDWAKAKCKQIYKVLPEMNGKEQVVSCFITSFLKENFDLLEDPEL